MAQPEVRLRLAVRVRGPAPWLSTHTLERARSNDAFDAETGVDVDKAESVVALTGNRRAVLAAANVSLLGGVVLLGRAVADSVCAQCLAPASCPTLLASHSTSMCAQGDLRVGLVLAAAIFMGYLYQGPPFRRACWLWFELCPYLSILPLFLT